MSKIGKKPIIIPKDVTVEIKDGFLEFKKGADAISFSILPFIKAEQMESGEGEQAQKTLVFAKENNSKKAAANWGTSRALAQNAVVGLSQGYLKALEIEGVGYRASMEGETLVLSVGFSHPVKFAPPAGIKISTEKNVIKVSGIDKVLVGQTAAKIRAVKKPEPYKGKGIRYQGEQIRRKAIKKAVGAGK